MSSQLLCRLRELYRHCSDECHFVGIIAVNAPCIKPLFSSSTWLGSSGDPYASSRKKGSYSLSAFGKSKPSQLESTRSTKVGGRSSDEFILRGGGTQTVVNDGQTGRSESLSDEEAGRHPMGGIQVTTMYEIRRDGSQHA
ncbi:hypothetical protein APSETT445_006532 [Aspergillus pseudonomiae]